MGRRTPPEKIDQIVQAGAVGVPVVIIAQETELAERTVRGLLRRHGAAVNLLRELKRDLFLSVWQRFFLDTADTLDQARAAGTLSWGDRQRAAIAMGIATEKALLLSGQPTQILADIHEHRLDLPDLITKLRSVSERIAAQPRIDPQAGSATAPATRSA